MNLYEISSQYQELLSFMNDEDLSELSIDDQHALIATKLNLNDDFKQRALSIAAFVCNLDLEATALKVMEQRLQVRRKANETKVVQQTAKERDYKMNQSPQFRSIQTQIKSRLFAI